MNGLMEMTVPGNIRLAELLTTLEDVAPFPAANHADVLDKTSSLNSVGIIDGYDPNVPFVVALIGPSGVGQDSVLTTLESLNFPYSKIRTATSRQKRDGEAEDAYTWMEHPELPKERAIGALTLKYGLLECEHYSGAYYGTPLASIFDAHHTAPSRPIIIKNDIGGAKNIKNRLSDTANVLTVNMVPESYKELWDRTTDRTNKVSRIVDAMRYAVAAPLIADYTVVNVSDASPETGIRETASLLARLIDKASGK